jgi:hypothetical protein
VDQSNPTGQLTIKSIERMKYNLKYLAIVGLVACLGAGVDLYFIWQSKSNLPTQNDLVVTDTAPATHNNPNDPDPADENNSPKSDPAPTPVPAPAPTPPPTPVPTEPAQPSVTPNPSSSPAAPMPPPTESPATNGYPWHTNITATVFWVGEPVGNGSSEDNAISAYDDYWEKNYGGFDDYSYVRKAANNYFPTNITPKQNPFYLDLPFDDINDKTAYQWRTNIPWYTDNTSQNYSYMKNQWVRIRKGTAVCYGQIEDAGPYVYHDANYVFGSDDARPQSKQANNAGLDVSPALRDCLGFNGLNNDENKVDWQFVKASDVPAGPWKVLVTTQQVNQP